MTSVQPCRPVTVLAFAGDRSGPFVARVFAALRDGRSGRGPGPSALECLLLAGHAGVSTDAGAAIFGFNPEAGGLPAWQVVYGLRNGDAFPGIVTDDTGVFTAARQHGLAVEAFDVLLPEPAFQFFVAALGNEKQQSRYSYGFPDGDGDCNCVTWIERLGLPLLTGRMDEFIALPGGASHPSRRFGRCLWKGRLPVTSDPAPQSDTSQQLGVLAMRFRRTRDEAARHAIAAEYAREVQRLIETGNWTQAPAFEDQLPDEWMPEAFYAYWCPDSLP